MEWKRKGSEIYWDIFLAIGNALFYDGRWASFCFNHDRWGVAGAKAATASCKSAGWHLMSQHFSVQVQQRQMQYVWCTFSDDPAGAWIGHCQQLVGRLMGNASNLSNCHWLKSTGFGMKRTKPLTWLKRNQDWHARAERLHRDNWPNHERMLHGDNSHQTSKIALSSRTIHPWMFVNWMHVQPSMNKGAIWCWFIRLSSIPLQVHQWNTGPIGSLRLRNLSRKERKLAGSGQDAVNRLRRSLLSDRNPHAVWLCFFVGKNHPQKTDEDRRALTWKNIPTLHSNVLTTSSTRTRRGGSCLRDI